MSLCIILHLMCICYCYGTHDDLEIKVIKSLIGYLMKSGFFDLLSWLQLHKKKFVVILKQFMYILSIREPIFETLTITTSYMHVSVSTLKLIT